MENQEASSEAGGPRLVAHAEATVQCTVHRRETLGVAEANQSADGAKGKETLHFFMAVGSKR